MLKATNNLNKNKHFAKKITFSIFSTVLVLFSFSCSKNDKNFADMLPREQRFLLNYGNFEDELNLFNMAESGEIDTSHVMHDGFFYIANGKAQKIMEFTSYGDLLGVLYNPDSNPVPSFAAKKQKKMQENSPLVKIDSEKTASQEATQTGTQLAVPYKFNSPRKIAVDGKKNIYVVDRLPIERQKQDENANLLLRDVVLRFTPEGDFIDFLGQRGSGGAPFPYISKIFTTNKNELVVICLTGNGSQVHWFNSEGFLLYNVIFDYQNLPCPASDDVERFICLENIVPSYTEPVLYLQLDYYKSETDVKSGVQEGIEYDGTYLYPLNVETGVYGDAIKVPSYEQKEIEAGEQEVFVKPFDFLGVSESGWFFFMAPNDEGYVIQIMQNDGQRIMRKQIALSQDELIYDNFSLSKEGIISALLASDYEANVVWWRTDSVIDALIKH